MSEVEFELMPEWARKVKSAFSPMHPPIFSGGNPTPEDIELTRALIDELDPESRAWYRGFLARHR